MSFLKLASATRNVTGLMQVVGWCPHLLWFVINLSQACWIHQVASNLCKSDLMELDISSLEIKSPDDKLASSLLTTCGRLAINQTWSKRYERIMINASMTAKQQAGNKLIADLLQLARFWLCNHNALSSCHVSISKAKLYHPCFSLVGKQ